MTVKTQVEPRVEAMTKTTDEAASAPRVDGGWTSRHTQILTMVGVFVLLYIFLTSIGLLGAGFKLFGKGFAKGLINTTANPFVGLFIGILATSVIQSSSTTTSMVVAFVASGTLTIEHAVPIVMGANIGTTVTATLVSLAHMTRRQEFGRAFSAATVHDFFNLIAVVVLLPVELATGFLRHSAVWLATLLFGSSSLTFHSPLKVVTKPAVHLITGGVAGLSKGVAGTFVAVLGMVLLFGSLYYLTKLMRGLVMERIESFFTRTIGGSGVVGILLGLVVTAVIQSSSVTTSLMVPMAAAGAVTLEQIFPITLGANMGTTVTALMASLAGNTAGLSIALVHFLFNLTGTLLIFPIPAIRRIPIRLAEWMGELASRRRALALVWVLSVFFVLPGLMVLVWRIAA